jgi:hypothetical protein
MEEDRVREGGREVHGAERGEWMWLVGGRVGTRSR